MNEIVHYFSPTNFQVSEIKKTNSLFQSQLHNYITFHSETKPVLNIGSYNIAIIGVGEDRNAQNNGSAVAPEEVRKYLYSLYAPKRSIKIVDLGNLRNGKTIRDTYSALQDVVHFLLKKNVLPIIIGGSQDLTYANYMGYKNLEQLVNLTVIDACFDFGNPEDLFDVNTYLSKIIADKDSHLFNYTNLAFQTYCVPFEEIEMMRSLHFDILRLGMLRSNIEDAETLLRDSDIVSFDIAAIKQCEAPATQFPNPNGLNGEEACQLAWYSGVSDRVSSFGIYNIVPQIDINGQTAHLAATIIWHFIKGFYSRHNDYPFSDISECLSYYVKVDDCEESIVFYQSRKSDRWWMQVPFPNKTFGKRLITACSQRDYETACNGQIPERWWKEYVKIRDN